MILITGSTGFIGQNFCSFVRERRQAILLAPRFLFDRTKEEQYEYFIKHKVSCLIHLAAAGVTNNSSTFYDNFQFNVIKSCQLIESAIKAGCNSFIVAGSCFEYGLTGNTVQFLDVNDRLMPVGCHAMSKAAFFLNLKNKYEFAPLNFSYLRIFQAYGQNEYHSRLYPSLCKAAINGQDFPMSSGEQIRDFIPVDDVCKAIDQAIDLNIGWNVQNICSGNPLSVLEFASLQWKLLGAKGQILPGMIHQKQPDLHRLVGKKSNLNNK